MDREHYLELYAAGAYQNPIAAKMLGALVYMDVKAPKKAFANRPVTLFAMRTLPQYHQPAGPLYLNHAL